MFRVSQVYTVHKMTSVFGTVLFADMLDTCCGLFTSSNGSNEIFLRKDGDSHVCSDGILGIYYMAVEVCDKQSFLSTGNKKEFQ